MPAAWSRPSGAGRLYTARTLLPTSAMNLSRLLISAFLLLTCSIAQATSVVFLNPGRSDEVFWVEYSSYMQQAAADLGVDLQVLYGERTAKGVLDLAREVLARKQKPDYLLFANEQFVGPEILRMYAGSGIKLFSVHSTLTAEQRAITGGPREKYGNWIGSLIPNDEEAGYLMAKALIELTPTGVGEMIAFSGIKQTPSATLREVGLQRALTEHPHVRLRQLVYGEWIEQRAYEQASALLPRYPQVSLVWSANDNMAFGVMRAAREQGRTLRYSALNNSVAALQSRTDGRLSVLGSGHFILGGCALVMIHDHAAGLDFAKHGGNDQIARLFRLLDAGQARRLLRNLQSPVSKLDFKRFSATRNPRLQRYEFTIDALLN